MKVREIAQFPKLVDELLALGVGEFSGVEEGLLNSKELEDQVWKKAVINARGRAEKTLKSAGMKLESVFAISPVAFPQITRRIFGESEPGSASFAKSVMADKVKASEYRLAPVSLSQSVHVIYLILPIE